MTTTTTTTTVTMTGEMERKFEEAFCNATQMLIRSTHHAVAAMQGSPCLFIAVPAVTPDDELHVLFLPAPREHDIERLVAISHGFFATRIYAGSWVCSYGFKTGVVGSMFIDGRPRDSIFEEQWILPPDHHEEVPAGLDELFPFYLERDDHA